MFPPLDPDIVFVLGIKRFGVYSCGAVLYVRSGAVIRAVHGLDFGIQALSIEARSEFAQDLDAHHLPAFQLNSWVRCEVEDAVNKSAAVPGRLDSWYLPTNEPKIVIPADNMRGENINLDAFLVAVAGAGDMTLNVGEVYYETFAE